MKNLGVITSLSVIMLIVFPIIIIDRVVAQSSPNTETDTTITAATVDQSYGCTLYPQTVHCDPTLNKFDSFEVAGKSTPVYPILDKEPSFVNGQVGNALEMRASYRESVEIGNSPSINPSDFSVSFWVKPTSFEPYGHIVSHGNKANTAGWVFDVSGQENTDIYGTLKNFTQDLRFGVFNSNGDLIAPKDITLDPQNGDADKFTHIVGTFDGSSVRLYKDGSLYSKADFTGNYSADPGIPLRIGSPAYCASCNRWSGIIDDVRMYNRTITDQEVKDIFNSATSGGNGAASSTIDKGIIGHWSFDNSVSDTSGNHNDGNTFTVMASMVFAPDGRLFFNEKNTGEIKIIEPPIQNGKVLEKPFAVIDDLYVSWEQGLLGMTLDPDFEQNHYVYAYYTATGDLLNGGNPVNKLIRFTEVNNTGTDMTVLLDDIPASRGYHSGGALAFGPDGKLYITVGDATEHPFAQDPSIPIGKVLRINKDGSMPSDNPYPDSPVYTVGHRNMYGIAFDSNGTGVVDENGDYAYDELNIIKKGGNYGFPTLQPPNVPPELSDNKSIKPIRSYWNTIAPTQMIYYDSDKMPQLKGKFLFGTYTGDIYAIQLDPEGKKVIQEERIGINHYPFEPVIAIAQSPDGDIYFGGYKIYKLESIDDTAKKQIVYPVDVQYSTGSQSLESIKITGIDAKLKENALSVHMAVADSSKISDENQSPVSMKMQISRGLIDHVSSVNLVNEKMGRSIPVKFTILDELSAGTGTDSTISLNLNLAPFFASQPPAGKGGTQELILEIRGADAQK